jgi:hypothetical protein
MDSAPTISSRTARMLLSASVLTPKRLRMARTSRRTTPTMGAKIRMRRLMTGATRDAIASGRVMAKVLGSTSPKISTRSVMPSVASATPESPNTRVSSAVASEADRMLTTLLPRRIAPIMRSLSSVTFSAVSAPFSPLSARDRSLPRDAAVSAVSDPEKKADRIRRPKIDAAVIQKAASREDVAGSIGVRFVRETRL